MVRTEVIHPSELSVADAEVWRAFATVWPAFANPLLGPDFAAAVGEVRADARVAIWRIDDRPVGFLPHHRRPGGFARPIGSPFSDYHALVSGPDFPLSAEAALELAGLAAFRFTGLIDPFGLFTEATTTRTPTYAVTLGDAEAPASRNRVRNLKRYSRKLEREAGPLRLAAPERDPAAFERLMGWKREQLARTGLHDVLGLAWTGGLMRSLFELREGPMQGLLTMLYAGDRPVAGHFGVRANGVFHPWIGAVDPQMRTASPGQIHQAMAIDAMPGLCLHRYDLGPDTGGWKAGVANAVGEVGSGLASAHSLAGRWARTREGVWTLPYVGEMQTAQRLRRRLDQIAAVELTPQGRVAGLIGAVAARDRRHHERSGPNLHPEAPC